MSEPFQDYLVHYRFQGHDWGATIKAQSFDDAKARIEAMGAWGRVDGILMAEIPCVVGAGLFVRTWVWLANLFRRAA